jgi:hypothetical protein
MRQGRKDVRAHTLNIPDDVWEWLSKSGNASYQIETMAREKMNEPEAPEWVSVTEQMPGKRESTQYLVMRDTGPYKLHNDVAVCDLVCRWWTMHGEIFDVTHWMELPEPPK